MRIAFFAAECAPLIKIGGLADVVSALPHALSALGHDVRIFLPDYAAIDPLKYPSQATPWAARVRFADEDVLVHVRESVLPQSNIPIYRISWPDEFQGDVYPLGQDAETLRSVIKRFTRFSVALGALLAGAKWQPELIHCHDWHTALVPALLQASGLKTPTVLTIHNIDIQGKWLADEVLGWLGGEAGPSFAPRDQNGDLNFLRLGISAATQVTTVSPTYASEILTPEYGEGLESLLRERGVVGIVNGIDAEAYNPATDRAIADTYDHDTWPAGKARNKAALQNELGLPIDPRAPLFVNIGRLVGQKGVDLLLPILDQVVARGGQVAFLGSGFPEIESALQAAARRLPGVAVRLGFNSGLGRQLYAGGDFFLMPSRFEPCGLGQLIAMRYGTIPVARDTGGIHDTVTDLAASAAHGTGLLFAEQDPAAAWAAIERAFDLFGQPARLAAVIEESMQIDHSWYNSATSYVQLYEKILPGA